MAQIKKGDVYSVKTQCLMRLKNSVFSEKSLKKDKSITILDIIDRDTVIVEINSEIYYVFSGELIDLIEEGFLSLENQTMVTSNNETLSKIKYRIVYALRSLLNRNENQAIIEQLAKWEIDPRKFNVSIYGNIDLKDHGDYEKAIHLIADKIVGE